MASSSRKRDVTSGSTGTDAHFLSDFIRTADIDSSNVEKRTKFIKSQLDNMSEDQLTRFEFFVRSHLSRGKVKDILSTAVTSKYVITDDMAIVVGSLAKLFVGELVETSMDVLGERTRGRERDPGSVNSMNDEADSGGNGLKVEHLREGYRRMQCEGKIGLSSGASFPFSKRRILQSTDESDSILLSHCDGYDSYSDVGEEEEDTGEGKNSGEGTGLGSEAARVSEIAHTSQSEGIGESASGSGVEEDKDKYGDVEGDHTATFTSDTNILIRRNSIN